MIITKEIINSSTHHPWLTTFVPSCSWSTRWVRADSARPPRPSRGPKPRRCHVRRARGAAPGRGATCWCWGPGWGYLFWIVLGDIYSSSTVYIFWWMKLQKIGKTMLKNWLNDWRIVYFGADQCSNYAPIMYSSCCFVLLVAVFCDAPFRLRPQLVCDDSQLSGGSPELSGLDNRHWWLGHFQEHRCPCSRAASPPAWLRSHPWSASGVPPTVAWEQPATEMWASSCSQGSCNMDFPLGHTWGHQNHCS